MFINPLRYDIIMTSDRITVMIDRKVTIKLRKIQADMLIKNPNKSVSFSKVLNIVAKCGLQAERWKKK